MASSNPFRKSVLQPKAADSTPPLDPIDTTQTHAVPPRTSFRDAEPEAVDGDEPEPERKKKPVKKVRVLTPPPLSPDSPEWPANEPMYQTGAGQMPPPVDYDPFGGSATDESDRDSTATPPHPEPADAGFATAPPTAVAATSATAAAPGGPPGNPFSRTLQDIEDTSNKEELDMQQREEGEVLKAANSGTPALDVDAFKRLLLTGNSGLQGDQPPPANDQRLASFNAEANKVVAAPEGAQDQGSSNSSSSSDKSGVPQNQRVVSPPATNKDKKQVPPPPPSSRHGKTIKPSPPEPEHPPVSSSSSETKPTPQQPQVPSADDLESASDEDSSTDSPAHEAAAPSSAKKPAPAPPPRRGHARTDTKTNLQPASSAATAPKPGSSDAEEPPSRSSIDSTTHAEKPRANIPAPPPRRRPHAAPKQSGAGPSPSISSSSIPQRAVETSASPAPKAGKSPAPPLPPARNPSSVRRPYPTASGGGGGLERRDSMPPPPPPPPRHRGSSPAQSGSGSRKSSADTASADNTSSTLPAVDASKGADILADLDALRREVEALRGAQ